MTSSESHRIRSWGKVLGLATLGILALAGTAWPLLAILTTFGLPSEWWMGWEDKGLIGWRAYGPICTVPGAMYASYTLQPLVWLVSGAVSAGLTARFAPAALRVKRRHILLAMIGWTALMSLVWWLGDGCFDYLLCPEGSIRSVLEYPKAAPRLLLAFPMIGLVVLWAIAWALDTEDRARRG